MASTPIIGVSGVKECEGNECCKIMCETITAHCQRPVHLLELRMS